MKGYTVQHVQQTPQQCGIVELTVEELESLVIEEIVIDVLPIDPDDELPAAA